MFREVILKTSTMFDDHQLEEEDLDLWKKIAHYMDGEVVVVIDCFDRPGEYIFLGLMNHEKDKELAYMMEQDGKAGYYINDRNRFDIDWETEEYGRDESFCINGKYVIAKDQEETCL